MKKSQLRKLIREAIKSTLNEAVHCTCKHRNGTKRPLYCRDYSNCEECCGSKNFPGLPPDWTPIEDLVRQPKGGTGDEEMEDIPTDNSLMERFQELANIKKK